MSVPGSPVVTPLMNIPEQPHGQSYSSGYESAFGNGLSPTTDYWKSGQWAMPKFTCLTLASGIYDFLSNPSSTSDDLNQDPDQSIFDGSGSETTGGPDAEVLDDDEDDDLDGFEVLSFSAPPESSVFFKGMEQRSVAVSSSNHHSFF